MAEVKPPEFIVLRIPSEVVRAELGTDDDRFIVAETATLPMPGLFKARNTKDELLAAIERALRALPPLSEEQVRQQLGGKGWGPDAIDASLARARRFIELETSMPFEIDRITRIGYRNRDGQEVVGKTGRVGPDNQRVFVTRCGVCGHEYGSYGCDADIRRCPECQDGAPGVTLQAEDRFAIRRAELADARALADAHRDSIESIGPAFYEADVVRNWCAHILPEMYVKAMAQGVVFYLALGDSGGVPDPEKQVLGFSSHQVEGGQHRTAVYVRGRAARRGIGSALFKAAEAHAVASGAHSIHVAASLAAVSFYKANGFEEIDGGEHQLPSGRRMACVFMRKTSPAR